MVISIFVVNNIPAPIIVTQVLKQEIDNWTCISFLQIVKIHLKQENGKKQVH